MILDNYLSYNNKVIIAIISGGIWIYFRTKECYAFVPRKNIFSVLFIMIWMYINYYEPLAAPIGLMILFLYTKWNNIKNFNLNK
jgi:magnesium-transporting ATPase (P-type)